MTSLLMYLTLCFFTVGLVSSLYVAFKTIKLI